MSQWKTGYERETDGKSLEYGPPSQAYFATKAAAARASAEDAAGRRQAGAAYEAAKAHAGRVFLARQRANGRER